MNYNELTASLHDSARLAYETYRDELAEIAADVPCKQVADEVAAERMKSLKAALRVTGDKAKRDTKTHVQSYGLGLLACHYAVRLAEEGGFSYREQSAMLAIYSINLAAHMLEHREEDPVDLLEMLAMADSDEPETLERVTELLNSLSNPQELGLFLAAYHVYMASGWILEAELPDKDYAQKFADKLHSLRTEVQVFRFTDSISA